MNALITKLRCLEANVHQDARSFRVEANEQLRYEIQGIQRACLARIPDAVQSRPEVKSWVYYYDMEGGLTFGRVSTLDLRNEWVYYWEIYLNNWFVVEVADF